MYINIMEKIIELFSSYELAKILKDKGFNDSCLAWYTGKDKQIYLYDHIVNIPCNFNLASKISIDAPTYDQIINWLDKKYNILISVCRDDDGYFNCKIKQYQFVLLKDLHGYVELCNLNISQNKQESLEEVLKEALKYI